MSPSPDPKGQPSPGEDGAPGAAVPEPAERDLRGEARRLQAILATTLDGFWRVGPSGRILDANEAYCRLSGYAREELLAMGIQDLEAEESPEQARQHIEAVQAKGFDRFRTRHRTRAGGMVELEVSTTYIPEDAEFVAFFRDLTEEVRLQVQEEQYRLLFDSSLDAMLLTSPDGTILEANPAAGRMFGMSGGELAALGRGGVTDPSDPRLLAALEVRARTGSWQGELPFLRADGTWFPGEVSSRVFTNRSGASLSSMIIRDLTARKAAEDRLKGSQEKLSTILQTVPDPVYVLDLETQRFVEVNEGFLRLTGYAREEVLGRTTLEIGLARDPEGRERAYQRIAQDGGTEGLEYECFTKQGKSLLVHINSAICTLQGQSLLVAAAKDITERRRFEDALLESEARLRSAVAIAHLGFYEVQEGRRATYFDAQVRAILGIPPGADPEQAFRSWWEQVHPEDQPWVRARHLPLMDGRVDRVDLEYRYLHPQSGEIWLNVIDQVLRRDPAGKALATVGVMRDITERRRAEEQLRASEEQFRLLAENATDLISRHAPDGTYRYASPSCRRLLGYAPEEMVGRSAYDFIPPEDHPPVQESHGAILGQEVIPTVTYRFRRKDGEIIWLETTSRSLRDGDTGAVREIQAVSRDITDRMLAQQELQTSRALLLRTQRAAHAGSWDWDVASGRLTWSEELFHLLGLSPGLEPTFDLWRSTLHPEDLAAAEAHIAEALAARLPLDSEYRVLLPEGQERWVNALGIAEYDPEGRPTRMMGICLDATERRRAEEKTRSMDAQIQHLQRLETIGRLAGGVAHDVNNVLGAIMAVNTLILKGHGDPAEHARLIDQATLRGRDLVKGLLDFARKGIEDAEVFDLNALVRKEEELLSKTTLQRIRIHLDLEEGLPATRGSPAAMGNALMNLCMNAVDAMPAGGTLTLGTALQPSGSILLVVADTGSGMPQEVLTKAMEPFYTTKPAGKGTGLGLSVVFGTVQAHGGTIRIDSRPGQGTRVEITLPAWTGDLPAPAEGPAPSLEGRRWRILLVDDDPLIRDTTPILLDYLGHQVTVAPGGREALDLIHRGPAPDVVLLDMNMPGLDGLQTLALLRTTHPDLPVMVASGYLDEPMRERIRRFPRVVILPKPYTAQDLQQGLADLA